MISVGEDDAGVGGLDLFWTEGFDGCLGADWHEHRGLVFLGLAVLVGKDGFAVAGASVFVLVNELVGYFHDGFRLDYEHGIAEGEKAIFGVNGVTIGIENEVAVGKS